MVKTEPTLLLPLGAPARRFSLPDTAAQDGVQAKYSNGVLEVRIPKQPQVQPRRIKVDAA